MKSFFFATSILFLAMGAFGQSVDLTPLNKTPGGQRVIAYFAAFNSGDEQKLSTFFTENIAADSLKQRPVEPRLTFHRQVRNDFQTMTIRKIVMATDSEIKVLAQSPGGEWAAYSFEFEPATSKINGFGIDRAETPAEFAKPTATIAAPATRSELISSTDRLLADLAKSEAFSGVVMIANADKPMFSKAYGEANQEKHSANNIDTKFNLGSINKMFTRIAIGQLIKQGKLTFDDKLIKILPDYPNRGVAEKITIGQIVTMSSGLGDIFNDRWSAMDTAKIRENKDYLPLFADKPLEFEPGTNKRYSNAGYVVLGLVIEKLSGKSYYDDVRENIFKPAGMLDTESFEIDKLPANTAIGYMKKGGQNNRSPNARELPGRGSSAGGGYSTAADMLKFSNALRSKKLEIPADDGTFPAEFKSAGFAGGSEGVNALFITNGQTGYTIIVLSNYDPPSAEKPGAQIRDWLKQVKD